MNIISTKEIEYITQIVNNSSIESNELRDDLIDHFCCAIEEEMQKGKTFKESYNSAYENICPDGFEEIQRESIFLLTSKKLKAMKRLMYLSGYLSAIGMTSSFFMKLNHIPGTQFALMSTAAIVMFVFLPALFINQYKRNLTKTISDKLKYVFGFIGLTIFILAVLFKVSHWPGATALILVSLVLINFAFFPVLLLRMYKR